MAIYLGNGEKLKINFNNTSCHFIISTPMPELKDTILLSFDNYILKDSNGVYLTTKEDNK